MIGIGLRASAPPTARAADGVPSPDLTVARHRPERNLQRSAEDGLSEGTHTVEMIYVGETQAVDRVDVVAQAARTQTAQEWEDWNPLR